MEFFVVLLGIAFRSGNLELFSRGSNLVERLADEAGRPFERGMALRARGVFEVFAGRPEKGLPLLQQRVSLVGAGGRLAEQLDSIIDLSVGLCLSFSGLAWSSDVCSQAMELSERLGDPLLKSRCLNNWAVSFLNWGYFHDAERQLLRALEVLGPHADLVSERAMLEANLGELYWLLERREEARSHWSAAVGALGSAPQSLLTVDAIAGLGLCALSAGDVAGARAHCTAALRVLRQCAAPAGAHYLPFTLAAALALELGRPRKALRILKRAAEELRQRRPGGYARLLLEAARLLHEHGREEAVHFAAELAAFACERGAEAYAREATLILDQSGTSAR